MPRTVAFAPLSCGKVVEVRRCCLKDLVHLKRLEEQMSSMTIEDILIGGSPDLDSIFASCVKLPDGVGKLELDSDDVCEIADKFREVNSRFLSRLRTLNTLMTLGEINTVNGDVEGAAMELLLSKFGAQLQPVTQLG